MVFQKIMAGKKMRILQPDRKKRKRNSRAGEGGLEVNFYWLPMQSKLNAFDDAAAEVIVTDTETMGWFGLRESVIFPRKQ